MIVVPEALFWYREADASVTMTPSERTDLVPLLRPHLASISPSFYPLIEVMLGRSCAKRPTAHLQVEVPLRYRLVDSVHERLKGDQIIYPVARRLIGNRLRQRSAPIRVDE
jgi:hypothetical protein